MAGNSKQSSLLIWILIVIVAGGFVLAYVYAVFRNEMIVKSRNLAPIKEVPAFSLVNQDGADVNPGKFIGHVWVANFIFTRCPGPCLKLTKAFASLQSKLPKDVKLVSFTLDPKYDAPGILKKYAIANGADLDRWTFLTGDPQQMRKVILGGFMVGYVEETDPAVIEADGLITHQMWFVLVDQKGRMRKFYDGTSEVAINEMIGAIDYLRDSEGK